MENNMFQNNGGLVEGLIKAVRCVGGIKPEFDPQANNFKAPQLTVMGTGFWVKNKNVFVTCAHVVERFLQRSLDEVGMLTVGGNGAPYRRATVDVIDYSHDLAILNVLDASDAIKIQCEQGLCISKINPAVATPVAYAGYPFGNQLLDKEHSPTYAEGVVGKSVVSAPGLKTIQISGPSVGGYSGSPVVVKTSPNSSYVVIGVLSNGPSDRGNTGNVFNAIHWQHLDDISSLAVG